MQANTINAVITTLDNIIEDCTLRKSRLGYFAVLYRMMTEAVLTGMKAGIFADAQRMEKLDVVFANRYLKAYFDYTENRTVSGCWKTAFDAAQRPDLILVQQLLLGINAHINLDLGIAAADISTAEDIDSLQADFVKINDTIADVYSLLQPRFTKISWPAIFLGKLDPRVVNNTINFSIVKARELAWSNAVLLCNAGSGNREQIISSTDQVVCKVANAIMHPAAAKNIGVKIIHLFEGRDVSKNIRLLAGAV